MSTRERESSAPSLQKKVLGRRADEGHCAVFDRRQERVLLRFIEAMNLVYEKNRAFPTRRNSLASLMAARASLTPEKTARGGRNARRFFGQQARQVVLARGRARPTESARAELLCLLSGAQDASLADQMLLPANSVRSRGRMRSASGA